MNRSENILSIIVPVYFNEQSISLLFTKLKDLEAKLIEFNVGIELIFVDDGSLDNSFQELKKIKSARTSTKIIKLSRNFGAVHASKIGIQHASGDCFIILAADLQDPPELIVEMINKWKQGNKFVICERQERDDPAFSKLMAFIYYQLVKLLVLKSYPKGGFDLALMDKIFFPYIQNSTKNLNTPILLFWLGFKPEVIYYKREKRAHGKSRWTFWKKYHFFLDSILGFSVLPIRIITGIGFFVSLVSFAYGSVIVINAIQSNIIVPGFPTIVSLLSFLFGLVIIMIGIIGEYVWRIFEEVNKRPEVVIETILD